MECIFCQIIAGAIPSEKVHETESLIVIKDIAPQAPTHLLAIPKAHLPTLNDCKDPNLLGELLDTARFMAKATGIEESGYRTLINTNADGGQVVHHLHLHILGGRSLSSSMG